MMMMAFVLLMTGAKLPTPPNVRTYSANLVSCYDGDTCTFDVGLHCNVNGDCGLGIQNNSALSGTLLLSNPPQSDYSASLVKRRQHVRLCDINAPELHPGPNPSAIKARDDLISWMQNKQVTLQVPQDEHAEDMYEKYGRLLVYIIVDGENLNQKQLANGNAKPFIQCRR